MPVRRLMAVAAFLSAASIVRVILGMAAIARRRYIDKSVIGVAVETACCCMAADQREAGLIVVKRHILPASRQMAIAATLTDRFWMGAIGFVAGYTGRWRRPVLAIGFVATGALQTIVLSLQGEIGILVLERGFVERDDVRVTSIMLGMAVRAVPALGVSVASVEALPGCDVISNILVAAGAKFFLFATLELYVARSALLLDIGVPGNDLTGHDQRFQLGMCVLKYQHAEYQYESGIKCDSCHRLIVVSSTCARRAHGIVLTGPSGGRSGDAGCATGQIAFHRGRTVQHVRPTTYSRQ